MLQRFRDRSSCFARTAAFLFFIWIGLSLQGNDTPVLEPHEYLVLTGGPALRFFEHGKAGSHDSYWFNFVDASEIRLRQIRSTLLPQDRLTWMVYLPSYQSRSSEMGRDLVAEITRKAAADSVSLIWFKSTDELTDYLNRGPFHKRDRHHWALASFDYFGHSNKEAFLFDYSNQIDGLSTCYLYYTDLRHIRRDIFSKQAHCQSWGCHSGQLYSPEWMHRFRVPLIGADGKTDFSQGGTPVLSDPLHDHWIQ